MKREWFQSSVLSFISPILSPISLISPILLFIFRFVRVVCKDARYVNCFHEGWLIAEREFFFNAWDFLSYSCLLKVW
jgi:hypothetical protein